MDKVQITTQAPFDEKGEKILEPFRKTMYDMKAVIETALIKYVNDDYTVQVFYQHEANHFELLNVIAKVPINFHISDIVKNILLNHRR